MNGLQKIIPQTGLRRLVENNPDGMIVIDPNGIVRFANTAAGILFGKTNTELTGNPIEIPTTNSELELRSPDKPPLTAELRSEEIDWEGEDAVLVTIRDITERKKLRETLKRNAQILHKVLDSSLTGVAVAQDDKIVYRNAVFEELFGPVQDLTQLVIPTYLDPDDPTSFASFLRSLKQPDFEEQTQGFQFLSKESSQKIRKSLWIHCRATLYEHMGRPAILFNTLDMTEIKEMEILLGIHDKMVSLGRMASGLTHDIRNALSSVNVYLSALKQVIDQPEVDEKAFKIVAKIQTSSNRIEAIIDRVRDFTKPSDPKLQDTNVNQLIEEAIELCESNFTRNAIQLQRIFDPNLITCKLDPQMITRALVNLLNNATDALKNQDFKKIEIATSSVEDKVLIRISDSGPGIPDHLHDSIFDPFVTGKHDGTGIGLSICQRIVTDHGGLLLSSNSELGGAEFVIELPKDGKVF